VFEANWADGLDDWVLTGDWRIVDNALERAGVQGLAVALAPYNPRATAYTIEAVMEPLSDSAAATVVGFAIQADSDGQPRVVAAPVDGSGRHTYRLEVSDDEVRFLVDGVVVNTSSNDGYLDPERVGLAAAGTALRVHSFTIIE
jgi:hypothetical protein